MFYTIYKTTNDLDGKIYIGKHQTENLDDDYLGSGKHLNRAIIKHGRENFSKEILYSFKTEEEMNAKEAELVSEDFIKEDTNYNLCPGGHGGFGYIRNMAEYKSNVRMGRASADTVIKEKYGVENPSQTVENRVKTSQRMIKEHMSGARETPLNFIYSFKGKSHTEESLEKMRKPKNKGTDNSQFGTMWITNGSESKKIKKENMIPSGWYKGRK